MATLYKTVGSLDMAQKKGSWENPGDVLLSYQDVLKVEVPWRAWPAPCQDEDNYCSAGPGMIRVYSGPNPEGDPLGSFNGGPEPCIIKNGEREIYQIVHTGGSHLTIENIDNLGPKDPDETYSFSLVVNVSYCNGETPTVACLLDPVMINKHSTGPGPNGYTEESVRGRSRPATK